MRELNINEGMRHWEREVYQENRKQYVNRMIEEGYEVIYPEDNEIQIDIDSDEQNERFLKQFEILEREFGYIKTISTISKNGLPGRHYRLFFKRNLSHIERIAYQAALCSDPVKELLSIFRLERGDDYPSLLVEVKK
jgi:hypothetical protein